jgi:hypothetical protein
VSSGKIRLTIVFTDTKIHLVIRLSAISDDHAEPDERKKQKKKKKKRKKKKKKKKTKKKINDGEIGNDDDHQLQVSCEDSASKPMRWYGGLTQDAAEPAQPNPEPDPKPNDTDRRSIGDEDLVSRSYMRIAAEAQQPDRVCTSIMSIQQQPIFATAAEPNSVRNANVQGYMNADHGQLRRKLCIMLEEVCVYSLSLTHTDTHTFFLSLFPYQLIQRKC